MGLPWLGLLLLALGRPVATDPCSKEEDNCAETLCCDDASLRCFRKNDDWANCRLECEPGVHEDDAEDFQTPWTCEQLWGAPEQEVAASSEAEPEATPEAEPEEVSPGEEASKETGPQAASSCSRPGEDCRSTGCCADPSMQCFEKNAEFATCLEGCEPGTHKEDPKDLQTPWSCRRVDEFCFDAFQQCGGYGHPAKGATCCKPGCMCDSSFESFHQCLPISDTAVTCEAAVPEVSINSSAKGSASVSAAAPAAPQEAAAVVRLVSAREERAARVLLGRLGAQSAAAGSGPAVRPHRHGVAVCGVVGAGVMAVAGIGLLLRGGDLFLRRRAPRLLLPGAPWATPLQDVDVE